MNTENFEQDLKTKRDLNKFVSCGIKYPQQPIKHRKPAMFNLAVIVVFMVVTVSVTSIIAG